MKTEYNSLYFNIISTYYKEKRIIRRFSYDINYLLQGKQTLQCRNFVDIILSSNDGFYLKKKHHFLHVVGILCKKKLKKKGFDYFLLRWRQKLVIFSLESPNKNLSFFVKMAAGSMFFLNQASFNCALTRWVHILKKRRDGGEGKTAWFEE